MKKDDLGELVEEWRRRSSTAIGKDLEELGGLVGLVRKEAGHVWVDGGPKVRFESDDEFRDRIRKVSRRVGPMSIEGTVSEGEGFEASFGEQYNGPAPKSYDSIVEELEKL